jgi:hypothetical protein
VQNLALEVDVLPMHADRFTESTACPEEEPREVWQILASGELAVV